MEQEHKQLVIGILAHVDSGKTTLSEALLYGTGTIRKLGRVDHKDAFLDTDALEKARGITIFSKQALFTAGNTDFTLLDTPGHVDFSTETERTLQVLDYAVLVVSGTDGVQSHTETLWRLLTRQGIPTFLFINKMDLAGTDRAALLEQLWRAYFRFHRNASAAAAGRPVLPPLPCVPQFAPERKRRIRRVLLVSLTSFVVFAAAAMVTSMLTAGAVEYWHVWGWFM